MGADRLHQERVLRHREDVVADGLPVPARDAREAVRDVLDLDVERRRVEEVEPPAGQHALPGARRLSAHHSRSPIAFTSPCRKQPVRWSLTMPTACMKA